MNDGKIIIDKIIAEAEEAAKSILDKAQKEADEILRIAQDKARKGDFRRGNAGEKGCAGEKAEHPCRYYC